MSDGQEGVGGNGPDAHKSGEPSSPLLVIVRWVGTGVVAFYTLKALFAGAFWTTVLGLAFTVGCYYLIPLAWWLGDAFRRFVRPDFYITSSTSELFYQRIFWMVGPQLVATFSLCAITAVVLDKATEATRVDKEGRAALKRLDKVNKEQTAELERMKKAEDDKKAESEAEVAKVKKEYAALVARADRYPDWVGEPEKAYQQMRAEIEKYKSSGENTQQEVESREEFEKRQEKNIAAFDAKLKSRYGKILGEGKCFTLRNTCYLEQIHLNKEGDSRSMDAKSLLFKVNSIHAVDNFNEQHYRHAPVAHVNLLGKVHEVRTGCNTRI